MSNKLHVFQLNLQFSTPTKHLARHNTLPIAQNYAHRKVSDEELKEIV